MFWWHADGGETPSILGRKLAWDSSYFNGEVSTDIVASGSIQAVRKDLGFSSGAALAEVIFGSTTSNLYVHRKYYEDFDVVDDVAIRTRVTGVSCPEAGSSGILSVGDIITGVTSGATGVINKFFKEGSHCAIYYNNQAGSINDELPVDFVYGETMTGPGGITVINNEGSSLYPTGTSRSFNNKIIRFWSETFNNSYTGAQGLHGSYFNTISEYTGTTRYWNKDYTNPLYQIPYQWITDEVIYKSSSEVGLEDGLWNYYQNGILGLNNPIVSHNADYPEPYNSVFQHQVSNGAQPNSFVYYDHIYIDDTWHRVLLCPESTWSSKTKCEIQIPSLWADNKITLNARSGSLAGGSTAYLYVVNKEGVTNENGYEITIE